MDQLVTEPIKAAGCILRAPDGSILMVKRVDDGSWAFPGGVLKDGETAEQAAYREVWEETGRRLGDVGKFLMRRIKDGCDYTTFLVDIDAPFVPTLNHEHSAFAWLNPEVALLDNRAESAQAIADSAGPEVPQPLYPTADEDGFFEPADDEKLDEDDIPDDVLDLALSVINDLDRRLSRLEDAADPQSLGDGIDDEPYVSTNTPVVGGQGASELARSLEALMETDL